MSPDGRYLYVATQSYGGFGRSTEGTILAFGRDPVTGALTQCLARPAAWRATVAMGAVERGRSGTGPPSYQELVLDPSGTSAYAAFVTGGTGLSGGSPSCDAIRGREHWFSSRAMPGA